MTAINAALPRKASCLSLAPSVRVAGALAACCVLSALSTPEAAGLALLFGLAMLVCARPAGCVKRLVAVNGFILFLWLTVPFSVAGSPVLTLGPLAATSEGLHLALLVTLKSNAMVLIFMALAASLPMPQFG
ncbi:MAG: CbiQ family ECF transporter T component, partial [Desulfovibrionaceae bacterium]|nr:CbiQ family ECF transporter T component [Desulfovibrionaceae bacterium]